MIRKRYRTPVAKPRELRAAYGRADRWSEPSIVYSWGGDGANKPDGRILSTAIEEAIVFDGKTLAQELDRRGYDLSTLRFSIRLKDVSP